MTAVIAGNEAAQRKIGRHIDARGRAQAAVEPLLNTVESVEADQGLMLGLAQANVPARYLQIARIKGLSQKLIDSLIQHNAVAACWKFGVRFEKALHCGPAIEPTAGIAFQRFANDGGERLVGYDHLAATRRPRVAIADRSLEHPIAVERPRPHPVHRLLAILLALVLGDAGKKMLDELAIGILTELHGRGFKDAACAGNLGPQLQVRFQPARKAADVVDDDDMRLFPVGSQMGEHRLHARPSDDATRHVILENLHDLIAAIFRELAAARFLAGQPVAARRLLGRTDAAINDSRFLDSAHGLKPSKFDVSSTRSPTGIRSSFEEETLAEAASNCELSFACEDKESWTGSSSND